MTTCDTSASPLTILCGGNGSNPKSVNMATKRLIKELDQYNKDPSPAVVRLEPVGDDITQLTAVLLGPEGTAYEGLHYCQGLPFTLSC